MQVFRVLGAAWAVAAWGLAAGAETLTVVSWGGSYEQASRKAVLTPFTAETGIEVAVEVYNGGLAQIRAQVETGNVYWDVVDLERADAVRACDEGLLELVDVGELPPAPDGTPAVEDYPPDAVTECGGGTLYYSTVVAYNTEVLSGERPRVIADFFDLDRFPGRRGMRRSPLVNLEFALLADGVPVAEVYATLATPEGVTRAFRKLDTIKDAIVWWEAGAQPPQMLADREVAMSTAYNGRIFNAQVLENQPLEILWDGQVLDSGLLGIVAGTARLDAALELVRFASRPEVEAAISQYISYGPVRRSAAQFVSTHRETGVDMRPHLPTSPENVEGALHNDWEWWSDHADDMNERFTAWLAR